MKKFISKSTQYVMRPDGTQIHVETWGKGKTILLFNGIACLSPSFHPQIEYLSQKYRLVLISYTGHGKTEVPSELNKKLLIDELVEDILYVCNKLKIKKCHGLSLSYGSQVMLRTYLKNPSLFHSIACISGFSKDPMKKLLGPWREKFQNLSSYLDLAIQQYPIIQSAARMTLHYGIFRIPSIVSGGFNFNRLGSNDHCFFHYMNGLCCMNTSFVLPLLSEMMDLKTQNLQNITCPALIMAGELDKLTPPALQQNFAKALPKGKFHLFENCSHNLQLEDTEKMHKLLMSFWKKHS